MPETQPSAARWAVEEVFDPQSPQFIACPFAAYDVSRRELPVAHHPVLDEWIVTGREELQSVLRDGENLTSRHNLDGHVPLAPEARSALDDTLFFQPALYNVSGPEHTRFRTFISEYFAPRRLRVLEPAIRATARRLVAELTEAGPEAGAASGAGADLLARFAQPLPYTVICDVIGIPEQDRAAVKGWNDAWLALQVVPLPAEQQVRCARALRAYEDFLRQLLADRAEHPAEDLITGLLHASRGDDPLCTVDQAVVALRFMIAAGHETTTNLISNAVHQLLTERERWDAVVADPALVAAAVEETLRFDSSVQGALRVATGKVRIGDTTVPPGARVRVMFAAAGRDPEWVEDAGTFRLDREGPPRHLGFGLGIHFCVGAPIARLEARIALETLAAALPGLRLADGFAPQYLPGGFIFHGLAALPVSWD
ncbi:cytochrome P450 [Streptomyces sp. NPDC006733]|uniref:cytochrome P450 n=1 Tax=Streptomyces sp. NPDC006733 TaxID=3155460 RepID=UPI0033CAC1E6